MFRRHFGRRGRGWEREEERFERHEGEGQRDFVRPHRGPGTPFPEVFPFFGRHGERGMHFAPPHHGHHGPPFGRGGPFGDDPFGGDGSGGGRQRQRRGDIKFILLELLTEQPRHGYDLIKELEQRYGGFYRPSPGSVYPTLQMLEEEGNLTSELVDGKRVYTITEAGRALVADRKQQVEERGGGRRGPFGRGKPSAELHELRQSMMALGASVMQIAQHGTPEQAKAAIEQLESTRRAIYAILAQEKPAE